MSKKKKISLVIGLILFVVLAAGSVGGSSSKKDDVKVNNGETTQTEAATEEKAKYEISDIKMESNSAATYIHGILKNNTDKEYGYIQVSFSCYDKDNNLLGTALANVNKLQPNGSWKFKAIYLGSDKPKECKDPEVTGF